MQAGNATHCPCQKCTLRRYTCPCVVCVTYRDAHPEFVLDAPQVPTSTEQLQADGVNLATSTQPLATSTQPPATSTQPPAILAQPPATSMQPPATPAQPPATPAQPLATSVEPPATLVQRPIASTQPPATPAQPPAISAQPSESEQFQPKRKRRVNKNGSAQICTCGAATMKEWMNKMFNLHLKMKAPRGGLCYNR